MYFLVRCNLVNELHKHNKHICRALSCQSATAGCGVYEWDGPGRGVVGNVTFY